ncbi:MAG: 3-oxoacyl-ACP reductase FabG [Saprospiraceae bacterium]|nr:3-oxoacyl-ACP reductase FabG [Saprospiraceae bacterium]
MNLAGKNYIVTGGSRGLGKSIVSVLAEHGCNVLFTYLNSKEEAKQFADQLALTASGKIVPYRADVSNPEGAAATIETAIAEFGGLNGIVNNAGITKDGAFFKMSRSDWSSVIDTNLNGVFYLSQAYLQKAVRGGGKIVNMSSVSGVKGMKGQANYCASKGGLIALTKSLALEYARFNIQINAIAPGYIETDMVDHMESKTKDLLTKDIPLRRLGAPREVANMTAFLLSDLCEYLTGQTIIIDGGLTV